MKRFVSILSIILAAQQAWATCTTIPGTSIQVGQGCFPRSSCPALNNPHDPINYGADNTGANDTSAAISSALAAGGDLYFGTPGTYKVDLTGTGTYVTSVGIKPSTNTKIECADGVTINSTIENAHDNGIFWLGNGGNTVCGCDFQGPNNGNPPLRSAAALTVSIRGTGSYL